MLLKLNDNFLWKKERQVSCTFLNHYGKKESIKSGTLKHEQQPLDDLLSQTTALGKNKSGSKTYTQLKSGKSFYTKILF